MKLKGKRTYLAAILSIITVLQSVIPAVNVIPADVSNALLVLLGAAVIYFRKKA